MTVHPSARATGAALFRHRHALLVAVGFTVARLFYWKLGFRFDATTLDLFLQFVDPELLRTDLLRSLFYLRDQPPLFNLFLGLVLKAFPGSYARAFQVAFVAMGAAGAFASYALARRLRAGALAAALIALAVSSSPTTVLYEQWLFYAYPLAVLWIVAALSLHAVLRRPTARGALVATGVVALIALTRGTVHLVVLVGVLGALALARRGHARAILAGGAAPVLLVLALYVKHATVFGGLVIGGFYRDVNIAIMQKRHIDKATLARLERKGRIPPGCPAQIHPSVDLDGLLSAAQLPAPPLRGVPILDRPWKSTGWTNWNSSAAEVVGRACAGASAALRHARPDAYGAAVRENVRRYLSPADRDQPLHGADGVKRSRLLALNTASDRVALVVGPDEISLTVVAGLVSALLLPCAGAVRFALLRKKRKGRGLSPELLITVFTAGIVAYSSIGVILYSWGDHNRYRAEIMPLVWVVVAASSGVGCGRWSVFSGSVGRAACGEGRGARGIADDPSGSSGCRNDVGHHRDACLLLLRLGPGQAEGGCALPGPGGTTGASSPSCCRAPLELYRRAPSV